MWCVACCSDFGQNCSPDAFSAAPRIWNWAYSNFKARVDELRHGPAAVGAEQATATARAEFALMLGSRCRVAQTGSALTSTEVFEWMNATFGPTMAVFDGYGSTEAGSIASNFKQDSECVVHLTDVPEMGYTSRDQPLPRGLLWVHTPTIAM